MTLLTESQVRKILRRLVDESSIRKAAVELDISPSYIQKVLVEDMPPGPKLLSAMGLERIVRYTRTPSSD